MKVIKFLTWDEIDGLEEEGYGGLGGDFKKGMRWKDYINQFKDEYIADLENLKLAIVDNRIRYSAMEYRINSKPCRAIPLWDNGKIDTYTMRGFCDLMAAIWSQEDNNDYGYMDFYFEGPISKNGENAL